MNPTIRKVAAGIGITGFVIAGATAISWANQPTAAPKTIQLVPATPAADTAPAADPSTTSTTEAAPASSTTVTTGAKMVPVSDPTPTTTATTEAGPVQAAPSTSTTEPAAATPTTTTTTAPPPCPDPAANVGVQMIVGGDPRTGNTVYQATVNNDSLNPIEVDTVEFTITYPAGSGMQNLVLAGGQGVQIDAGGTGTFQVGDPVARTSLTPDRAISQFHYHAVCG